MWCSKQAKERLEKKRPVLLLEDKKQLFKYTEIAHMKPGQHACVQNKSVVISLLSTTVTLHYIDW